MRAYITAFAISPKAGHLSNNRINFSKAIVIANKTCGAGILPGAIMGRISIIGIPVAREIIDSRRSRG